MNLLIKILVVIFIIITLADMFGSGKQELVAKMKEVAVDVVEAVKPAASALTERPRKKLGQYKQGMARQLEDLKQSDVGERLQVLPHRTKQTASSMKQSSEDLIHRLDKLIHSIEEEQEGGKS